MIGQRPRAVAGWLQLLTISRLDVVVGTWNMATLLLCSVSSLTLPSPLRCESPCLQEIGEAGERPKRVIENVSDMALLHRAIRSVQSFSASLSRGSVTFAGPFGRHSLLIAPFVCAWRPATTCSSSEDAMRESHMDLWDGMWPRLGDAAPGRCVQHEASWGEHRRTALSYWTKSEPWSPQTLACA